MGAPTPYHHRPGVLGGEDRFMISYGVGEGCILFSFLPVLLALPYRYDINCNPRNDRKPFSTPPAEKRKAENGGKIDKFFFSPPNLSIVLGFSFVSLES